MGDNIEKIDFDIIKSIQNNGGQPVTKKWKRHENFKDEPYDLMSAKNTYTAGKIEKDKQARVERTVNVQKNAPQYRTEINQFHFVSGLAFGYLAYTNFSDIPEYNKIIDLYDDIDTDDLSDMEKDLKKQAEAFKNRALLKGLSFSLVSLMNVVYSFEKVEIKANTSKFEVSYKF